MVSGPGAGQSHQNRPVPLDGDPEESPPWGPRPFPPPLGGSLEARAACASLEGVPLVRVDGEEGQDGEEGRAEEGEA